MVIQRKIESQTIRADCSQTYVRAAENVLTEFEKLARSGKSLSAGTDMRFGWTLFHLTSDQHGLLVTEPDFASWPQQSWSSNIDRSLEVLTAQVRLLNRLDVDGEDAYFDQFVVAAPGALSQPRVFLRRAESIAAEDSGWLLGSVEDPEALAGDVDLERIAIASLVRLRRAVLQALTLPRGFVVQFFGDSLEQIFDSAGRARLPLAGKPNAS